MNRIIKKIMVITVILSLLFCISCGNDEQEQSTGNEDVIETHIDKQTNKEVIEIVNKEDTESESIGTEESVSTDKPVVENKNNAVSSKPANQPVNNKVQENTKNDTSNNTQTEKPNDEKPSTEAPDAGVPDIEEPERLPWEEGGKQPAEYTWAEFEALTAGQQMAFQNSFGSIDAFDVWLQKAQAVDSDTSTETDLPWENGGKQPSDYTWAEFEALTAAQQMAFQNSFGSVEAFDAWLQKAQTEDSDTSTESDLPWENGGKQPSDYTWAEFEALTAAEQMAFQNSFGSIEAFDAWLQKAQADDSVETDMPWENGGKQPADYTWAEFEALTAAEQMAFQNSFGSIEAFDAWLQKAQADESEKIDLPWENGGKQPVEYTWAEFEALTGEQQIAFQKSFGSIDDFDKWLTANQPQ